MSGMESLSEDSLDVVDLAVLAAEDEASDISPFYAASLNRICWNGPIPNGLHWDEVAKWVIQSEMGLSLDGFAFTSDLIGFCAWCPTPEISLELAARLARRARR
jgi:hypothetical protein